jgi:hypothetical protein
MLKANVSIIIIIVGWKGEMSTGISETGRQLSAVSGQQRQNASCPQSAVSYQLPFRAKDQAWLAAGPLAFAGS